MSKRTFLSLLILFGGFLLTAQELVPVFGPFIQVTPTNVTGSTRPRIALVQDSIPIVTWVKLGPPAGIVYVARWNGSGFGTPVQISPSGIDVYCSAEEGGDIAARGDTAYIVFFTASSECYSVHSYDAGLTWSDTVRIDHQVMNHAYTPNVEIDRNGNPVIAFEMADMSMANAEIMVCRSYDGGNTFTMEQPAHLSVSGVPCECCPPTFLNKDENAYVIYRNNDNNRRDIVMTMSSDSGMTFTTVSEVDQTNWTISSCPTAGAEAAFYRDSILIVWKSTNKLYYGCGHNATGATGPDNLLEPSLAASVLQKHPVVSTIGDTVIFLWDDRRTTNYDCYISIVGNGAHQITAPFILNDTIGTAETGTQQTPHVALEGDLMHIVYQNGATGIVMYRTATIGGGLSVAEHTSQTHPLIFPVPAKESFTISNITGKCTVSIYNMNGELVVQQLNVISGNNINIESFVRGSYSVVITTEEGNKTSLPLIKQ